MHKCNISFPCKKSSGSSLSFLIKEDETCVPFIHREWTGLKVECVFEPVGFLLFLVAKRCKSLNYNQQSRKFRTLCFHCKLYRVKLGIKALQKSLITVKFYKHKTAFHPSEGDFLGIMLGTQGLDLMTCRKMSATTGNIVSSTATLSFRLESKRPKPPQTFVHHTWADLLLGMTTGLGWLYMVRFNGRPNRIHGR